MCIRGDDVTVISDRDYFLTFKIDLDNELGLEKVNDSRKSLWIGNIKEVE